MRLDVRILASRRRSPGRRLASGERAAHFWYVTVVYHEMPLGCRSPETTYSKSAKG
jgi:hypothetical protein